MFGKKRIFEIEYYTSKTQKGETEKDSFLADDADEALDKFKTKHPTDTHIVGMRLIGAQR